MEGIILVAVSVVMRVALFRSLLRACTVNDSDAPPKSILLLCILPALLAACRQAPAQQTLLVQVVGHQYWWEFKYPALGIDTAGELHLPLGRRARLQFRSGDVVHTFRVFKFGGERAVVPGQYTEFTFIPHTAGRFAGDCGVYCGSSHGAMRFEVLIDPPERFAKWAKNEAASAATPEQRAHPDSEVVVGALLYAGGVCTTCHTVEGVSAGKIAPNLTHFGSRRMLAGAVENNQKNLTAWLRDPQKIKRGVRMPVMGLTDQQASELAAYLESLK